MSGAQLEYAWLQFSNLHDATLTGAAFGFADVMHHTVSGAQVGDSNFQEANLSGATLSSATLTGSTFLDADLGGTRTAKTPYSTMRP